ncbi:MULTISPECIES: ATP-dependent endonuclease [Streptomyces]|uniref:ATP-dependent nuclease n=1 Tax=Streptomyces TaxID=1883 RepID=UPI0021A6C4A1|nr:AAA family ATPase [Streptomyces sp. Ag109_G2-6]
MASGIDAASLGVIKGFYDGIFETTVRVSGPKVAELAKLIENTFRLVNISMINELATLTDRYYHPRGRTPARTNRASGAKPRWRHGLIDTLRRSPTSLLKRRADRAGGNMAITFAVTEIMLNTGLIVEPPQDGMTLFIGANNSGKSLLLRELNTQVELPGMTAGSTRWIRQALPRHSGSSEEFMAWLEERGYRTWTPRGDRILKDSIAHRWPAFTLAELAPFVKQTLWTDDRLQVEAEVDHWDPLLPSQSRLQYLYEDRDAESRFADLVHQAFGHYVCVDRYDEQIRLRVGRPHPDLRDALPGAAQEVAAAYRYLPLVSAQGDGFRSFVQILLQVMVRPAPLVIIDEPEAFLHPPQARLLGRLLAGLQGQTQLFVATHSADFLAGVLEAEQGRPVSIVRLDRSSGTPAARVLKPDAVQGLLRTPLLRYSNLPSGLFYDRVVLCEAAGDCQFYAAAFDATKEAAAAHDNTLFLHTSGKAPLGDTARRLRQCGIPTAVIADFDYLRSGLARAVKSLEGVTEHLESDLKCLREHAAGSRSEISAGGFKTEMDALLKGIKASDPLPDRVLGELTKLAKGGDRWGDLKKSGLGGLQGDPYNAAERLLRAAADFGLFVVPCGELESWVRQVPRGDKALWSQKVFDNGWYARPTEELKAFCSTIRAYLKDGVSDYARAAAQALQVSSRLDHSHAVVSNSSNDPLTEVRVLRATYTHGGRQHIQPLWGTPESKTSGALLAGDEFSVPLILMSDGDGDGHEWFLPPGSTDQALTVHFRDRAGLWWERIGDKPPFRLPAGPSEPDPAPQ